MCGRFYVDDEMARELEKICKNIDQNNLAVYGSAHKEIHPSEKALALTENLSQPGEPQGKFCKWGYTARGEGKLIINARAETVMEKPLFRYDFEYHRCVIPARGFYEWNEEKHRYIYQLKAETAQDKPPILFMAGIYHRQPGDDTFTIITTKATDEASFIHDRIPLLLNEDQIVKWIYSRQDAVEYIKKSEYGRILDIMPDNVSDKQEKIDIQPYQYKLNL